MFRQVFFFFFPPAPEQLAYFLPQRTFLSICVPWMIKWLAKLNECVSNLYNWMIHFWEERLCVCCVLSRVSCVRLFATPWSVARQSPLSTGFSKQEYCSGLPFPSARDFPDPGMQPGFPALQVDSLPSEPPGKWSAFTIWFPEDDKEF